MKRLIALTFAALTATAAHAQGPAPLATSQATECRIRVIAAPASWLIEGFDPFSGRVAEGTYSATFTNDSAVECTFTPSFELRQPPFGLSNRTGSPINYVLLDLSDAQDVTPRAGRTLRRAAAREITLGPNESKSVLYKLVADSGSAREAGTFTQDLTIEAQDRTFRSLGGTPVVVGLTVLPSARIGLAGAYTVSEGQAVVNLGTLREGVAPVPLQLRVSSTAGYEISVSSANSGRLRLGMSDWTVPYTMAIGNDPVNLAGARTVAGQPATGFRRDVLPIRFIIGDVSGKRAGAYTDTISVSVTAR